MDNDYHGCCAEQNLTERIMGRFYLFDYFIYSLLEVEFFIDIKMVFIDVNSKELRGE